MKSHLNNCPNCLTPLRISRYECPSCGTAIEGDFTGCPFCRLDDEDSLFALVFIQTEGNMKDVERLMGISYPTVKSRLARLNKALAGQWPKLEISLKISNIPAPAGLAPEEKTRILDRLEAGEITAKEASRLLRGEAIGDESESDID